MKEIPVHLPNPAFLKILPRAESLSSVTLQSGCKKPFLGINLAYKHTHGSNKNASNFDKNYCEIKP